MISTITDEELRKRTDTIQLSPRLQELRAKYFEKVPQVCAQRLKLAMEAWKETEYDHLGRKSP